MNISDIIKIRNLCDEKLDVAISGKSEAKTAVVMAHSFGSNKDGGDNLFLDIARFLEEEFKVIRFDFSGHGESEGKQEEVSLAKMRGDLFSVVEYAKTTHNKVFLLAHSLGTMAFSSLCELDVERIAFTSPPNPEPELLISNLQSVIKERGGELNEAEISTYQDLGGQEQRIGEEFWQKIREFDHPDYLRKLCLHSSLGIFIPKSEEAGKGAPVDYWEKFLPFGLKHKLLPGNHDFTDKADRQRLAREIKNFFCRTKMIFVAHPVSGNPEENIRKVTAICASIHDERTIPVFPSFLWRQYLGDKPSDQAIAKIVNKEYLGRGFIDEVWHYGPKISDGMMKEALLASSNNIANIGKNQHTLTELIEKIKF